MSDFKEIKRSYVVLEEPKEGPPAISIDDTIKDCLICVKRIVTKITADTSGGRLPDRNTVMTLKDCMSMLFEAKKKEQEILEDLSEDELQKMLNK